MREEDCSIGFILVDLIHGPSVTAKSNGTNSGNVNLMTNELYKSQSSAEKQNFQREVVVQASSGAGNTPYRNKSSYSEDYVLHSNKKKSDFNVNPHLGFTVRDENITRKNNFINSNDYKKVNVRETIVEPSINDVYKLNALESSARKRNLDIV